MSDNNTKNRSYGFALFFIGCLFFSYGFITWANSALIPYLKLACELTDTQSYLVATAFFAAYFFMALPSSIVLKWVGFKRGMSVGLLVMAAGALLFLPAASTRSYPLFLTGLFVIGSGMALLQTASNPYAAALGPMESAARRISIMGICNKIAGVISVYVLSGIMLKDADVLKAHLATLNPEEKSVVLDNLAEKVVMPYSILAFALALLAVVFFLIKLPEISDDEIAYQEKAATKRSIFQFPHLILGVVAIFFYVGVEVISYDTFTGFGEELGYKTEYAATFATYTGYGLLVGYILSIVAIPKYISQRKALTVAVLLSMILVIVASFTSGTTAVVSFALLGFSNSVMWPAIWPLSLDRLGKFTKTGSALLVMGIVGGAVLTPFYGKVSEWMGSKQLAYLIMIPCYLYILYFSLAGYRIRK
jgi:FHS family L-fucose permease-like MFS transporter